MNKALLWLTDLKLERQNEKNTEIEQLNLFSQQPTTKVK